MPGGGPGSAVPAAVCRTLVGSTTAEEFEALFDAALQPEQYYVEYVPHQPTAVPTLAQLVPWGMAHESDRIDHLPVVPSSAATTLEVAGLPAASAVSADGGQQPAAGAPAVRLDPGCGESWRAGGRAAAARDWGPKEQRPSTTKRAQLGMMAASLQGKLEQHELDRIHDREDAGGQVEDEEAALEAQRLAIEEEAAEAEVELARLRQKQREQQQLLGPTDEGRLRDQLRSEAKERHQRWADLLKQIHTERLEFERVKLGAHALWKEAEELYGSEECPPLPWVEKWVQRTRRRVSSRPPTPGSTPSAEQPFQSQHTESPWPCQVIRPEPPTMAYVEGWLARRNGLDRELPAYHWEVRRLARPHPPPHPF